MIDMLCVAELAWVLIWIGTRPRWRALLYTIGIFISAVTAYNISGWLENTLTPVSSQVFHWLREHVNTRAQSVVIGHFLPPQSAWTGGHIPVQWIAHSVLKSMLFFAITGSVFLVFVILGQLVSALWDLAPPVVPTKWIPSSMLLGLISAVYLTLLTVETVGNLAWIKDFSILQGLLSQSLLAHLTGRLLTLLQLYT
ncbi:hypothetical protein [Alicyclobacillus sp. SO9]|uniref:hypothetical protein n=1 Tax=Alicyclobacillus sp. SO9 TaxID=2665646 RepID=UPI0018E87930|nr:hypothetical protein [Alicyclobacillus sp. SO9]QQE78943.1 hypothetical protein GI364_24460 [Alicyclobacillus sp. SO9]